MLSLTNGFTMVNFTVLVATSHRPKAHGNGAARRAAGGLWMAQGKLQAEAPRVLEKNGGKPTNQWHPMAIQWLFMVFEGYLVAI